MDVLELLRMLRAGESDRIIAQRLHHNRRTVGKYRTWAQEHSLLTGPLPTSREVHQLLTTSMPAPPPPQQTSSVAPYAAEIAAYRARGMEVAAIQTRLQEVHQHSVSYSAVWRFVQHLEPEKPPETFVRVEVKPGSEAQVDFGYGGLTIDPTTGKLRKTWVFVLLLSFSRHEYAELVFDQRVETWLLCHRHAFESFGGVPARITPDNLKAAILTASFTDPVVQRSYRECAEHYGFLIDPNPPRSPHLKGKVEQGGVHYVKRNFLAGRTPQPITELNQALRVWLEQIAGQRIHGTIRQRPLERFHTIEAPTLLPLPPTPYDPAVWKQVTVYRDCYVTFEQSYYSAPYRLVGQELWLRGGARTVELYTADHELVFTHDRATEPGQRKMHPDHMSPEKLPGLMLTRETCRLQAEAIGPATSAVVHELLDHRPVDRLRVAGRVLGLAHTYSSARLERACARTQHYGQSDYPTVKRILQEGLDQENLSSSPTTGAGGTPRPYAFVRQAGEFMASLVGGGR